MNIYIAGKISGNTYEECATYFGRTKDELTKMGYFVFSPMTTKAALRTEYADRELPTTGYTNPIASNHAIFERDQWCVRNSDVVYVNLLASTDHSSIGCAMELAWASLLGKHTIVAMQKDNPNRHAFVLEAADLVVETHEEAMAYLDKLIHQTG